MSCLVKQKIINKIMMLMLIVSSIPIFLTGIISDAPNVAFTAILMLFIGIVIYSISMKERALLMLFFLITFFVFLLGKYAVLMITGQIWWDSLEIINHTLLCLYISLFCVFGGFYFSKTFSKQKKYNNKQTSNNFYNVNENIIKVIKMLFFCTISFKLISVLEKVIFVQNNSYLSLYTEYKSRLPYLFTKVAEANTFIFYTLLSTMPSKSTLKIPAILFLCVSILSMFSGVRGSAIVPALIVIMYYTYREICHRRTYGVKYKWIKKRYICVAVVFMPFVISLLNAYNFIRSGISIEHFNFFTEFIDFFKNQGGSVEVIGYVKKYENSLPSTNISYLFGPIISFLKYGFIGSLFRDGKHELYDLVNVAMYGNNLGATITYLVMPQMYLNGVGLGTQYIAEAYADFSYIGVALYNLFLGYILYIFNFNQSNKWYLNAIIFSIYSNILTMPRNFALSWAASFVSILHWGIILFIIIFSKILNNKKVDA